jgi:hypothetical protein
MSDNLRNQIYQNLNIKESDELLEIWQENDRVEWSDMAFEVIKEILMERLGEVPPQSEPIYEYLDKEGEAETYGFSEIELKLIDDENPPEFYDPLEALKISKWIEKAAIASIVISSVTGLTSIPVTRGIIMPYFYGHPSWSFLAAIIAVAIIVAGVLIQIAIIYFPLRALAHILKVLMQMEFNSRKV